MTRCAWCDADISEQVRVYVIESYPDPRPAFGSVNCHNLYKQLWSARSPIPAIADRKKPHRCPVGPKLVVANATIGRDYPPPRPPVLQVVCRPRGRPVGSSRGSFVDNLLRETKT